MIRMKNLFHRVWQFVFTQCILALLPISGQYAAKLNHFLMKHLPTVIFAFEVFF